MSPSCQAMRNNPDLIPLPAIDSMIGAKWEEVQLAIQELHPGPISVTPGDSQDDELLRPHRLNVELDDCKRGGPGIITGLYLG